MAGAPGLEPREIGVDLFEIGGDPRRGRLPRIGAGQQVLLDRQVGEAMPPLHDLDQAALDELGGFSASMRSPRT